MKIFFLLFVTVGLFSSFSHREFTWVAVGDSITYLNDHLDETGGRVTKGYLTDVAERLPYIHYINQGHNGWTSGDIARDIEKIGLVKADVYSVFLGTNDWWQGRPLGRFSDYLNNTGNGTVYGSYRIIMEKLRSLNGKAKIILVTPMQRTDFVYINDPKNNAYGCYKEKNGQSLSSFAKVIDSIGRYEHFDVVDLYNNSGIRLQNLVKFKRLKDTLTGGYRHYTYPGYIGIPFDPATDAYPYPKEAMDMSFDGLHPSDRGNAVIASMLEKTLEKY